MDTTLRDGEQTPGIAFTQNEKLNIAKILLDEIRVDRVEVGSARISAGEKAAVTMIADWASRAGVLDRVEVLGFVDKKNSVDWIDGCGVRVINLLSKGSLRHVTSQLRKTPEEHIRDVRDTVEYAVSKGLRVNVYLEDWSNGMKDSRAYVTQLMDAFSDLPVTRFMLPDTLGILTPDLTGEYVRYMLEHWPEKHFDFHAHNDYDLAVANTLAAVKSGVHGIHATVNGLGERTGNATLSSVVSVLADHFPEAETNVVETGLNKISRIVEAFSGIRIPANKPIVGDNVFTQTCGVHADGDSKDGLYFNALAPERFGRMRKYALGKTSGKASVAKNLEELGIVLDKDSLARVTARIVEMGDLKENVTTDELPYIISDVLGNDNGREDRITLRNFYLCKAKELHPTASLSIEIDGKVYEDTETGDGQYDAFMKALKKVYTRCGKTLPDLIDYVVSIPPGGQTSALVETVITWRNGTEFKTRGLDPDQTASAIKATMKMLNRMEYDAAGE